MLDSLFNYLLFGVIYFGLRQFNTLSRYVIDNAIFMQNKNIIAIIKSHPSLSTNRLFQRFETKFIIERKKIFRLPVLYWKDKLRYRIWNVFTFFSQKHRGTANVIQVPSRNRCVIKVKDKSFKILFKRRYPFVEKFGRFDPGFKAMLSLLNT